MKLLASLAGGMGGKTYKGEAQGTSVARSLSVGGDVFFSYLNCGPWY